MGLQTHVTKEGDPAKDLALARGPPAGGPHGTPWPPYGGHWDPSGPSLGTLYINTLKSVGRLHGQLNTLSYHNSHYYLLVVLPTPSNHIGLVLSSHPPSPPYPRTESTIGTRDTLTILYHRIKEKDLIDDNGRQHSGIYP